MYDETVFVNTKIINGEKYAMIVQVFMKILFMHFHQSKPFHLHNYNEGWHAASLQCPAEVIKLINKCLYWLKQVTPT